MKKLHVLIILYLLVVSCNEPLFSVDEKLKSDFSILGFVTLDSVKVQVLKNHAYNVKIRPEDNVSIDDAIVILLDSFDQTLATLNYDDARNVYFVKGLNLSNSGKYKIEVISTDTYASSTLVSIPDPIKIEDVSIGTSEENGLTNMTAKIKWEPSENESLETEMMDIENALLYIYPQDFDNLSQCYNDLTFTTLYYQRCFDTEDIVNINQSFFLEKESYSGPFIPAKTLTFSACSKEYTEFINSIYFVEDFERAFVNTSVIKSNIVSDNSTGYFFGKATENWPL